MAQILLEMLNYAKKENNFLSTNALLYWKEEEKYIVSLVSYIINKGGSVIPAAVKTPDNKFARIIKPGRNMPAVKTPDKKICLVYSFWSVPSFRTT